MSQPTLNDIANLERAKLFLEREKLSRDPPTPARVQLGI